MIIYNVLSDDNVFVNKYNNGKHIQKENLSRITCRALTDEEVFVQKMNILHL